MVDDGCKVISLAHMCALEIDCAKTPGTTSPELWFALMEIAVQFRWMF